MWEAGITSQDAVIQESNNGTHTAGRLDVDREDVRTLSPAPGRLLRMDFAIPAGQLGRMHPVSTTACACLHLPRSADWSCLEGLPPSPDRAAVSGMDETRMRCRNTGLVWMAGYAMDRAPEPYSHLAPESFGSLVALVEEGRANRDVLVLALLAQDVGQWEPAARWFGELVAAQGGHSPLRLNLVRAQKRLGRWKDVDALLSVTVRKDPLEAHDVEQLLAARHHLGTLGQADLVLLNRLLSGHGALLRRGDRVLPVSHTAEPEAFSAYAPLFLALDQMQEGIAFLAAASTSQELSIHLPLAWAYLLRIQGQPHAHAVETVLQRIQDNPRVRAAAPWEAAWTPIFWTLLEERFWEPVADVLVALGARSTAAVLKDVYRAEDQMVCR